MAMQEGFAALAKQGLTAREWSVLAIVMSRLDFENFIHLSQADIAKELRLDRSDVSRAFRRLMDEGVILKGPKVGRSATYRLAPDFGWKGRVRMLEQYRRDRLRLVQGHGQGRLPLEGGTGKPDALEGFSRGPGSKKR